MQQANIGKDMDMGTDVKADADAAAGGCACRTQRMDLTSGR
jgi:hypothetical protein